MIGVLILAGGQGKRVGGNDKGLLSFEGKMLIHHLLDQFSKQAKLLDDSVQIVISANRNQSTYQSMGFPVISDLREGFCGPLAGIESVLYQAEFSDIERWIVCPVDSPCLPENYLSTMLQLENQHSAYLRQGDRHHYAHLSVPSSIKNALSHYLNQQRYSIRGWLAGVDDLQIIDAQFEAYPILNLNTLSSCQF